MRIKSCLVILMALLWAARGHSQCNNLGQNPTTAFPVCGTASLTQNTVPLCAGLPIPGPCGAGLADINPFWYRFTCYVAGTLGFLIRPFNATDDYDWQLFDITGRNPNDVYTDPSLFVACNWSGFGGLTGASAAGTNLVNCEGNVPLFSRMPVLIVGHDYVLLVSHFTNTQSGYQLSFTGGTAVIADPANPIPEVTTATPSCDGTQVVVRFNKKVKCNSLALNGSDFIISPSGTILSAVGNGCAAGFDMDSVTLTLNAPLPPGNYTVQAVNGSDGNTLLDNCDHLIAVADDAAFTVIASAPLPMGVVTPPPCAPTSLTLTFTDPVKCNSVAANGSDFVITGPSAVTITSATAVNCNGNGETNIITVQLAAPILVGGTYQLLSATGTDGNTVIGPCNRQVTAGSNAQFVLALQAAVAMGVVTPPPCTPSSITLTFSEPIKCNSIAANGSDFIITGASPVTITSATTVACNANGETNSVTIQFTTPVLVAGTYQVQAATGSDGNTVVGQCNREVTAGSNAQFVLAPQPAIAMGTITPPSCAPSSITLTFADPILCSTVAANGSDFTITGPSPVTITSAIAVNCNGNGETNTITIQFAAPVLIAGTYQVQAATGSDGNTVVGQCNRQLTTGSNVQFVLAPQAAIAMGTVIPPPCIPTSITLNFAEPIQCNSIAANGSDFIITGASPVTITSAIAVTCNGNGETNSITIQFLTAILVTGNYQVQVATGSDGNTLAGQCGRLVNGGDNAAFILAPQPLMPMGTVTPPSCAPSSVVLSFTIPVNCLSVAADGSDFIITGPSPVTITSAGASCNTNLQTQTITLQFATPITTSGTYQLQVKTGSDGTTLSGGNCNNQVTAGDFTTFTIPDAPPVLMDNLVPVACSPSSLRLIFAAPVRCASVAANGSDFIISGPSPVTIASAAGTCDANGLTSSIDIRLLSPVVVGGNYQLQLVTGSDGNTLLSECYRVAPVAVLNFIASDTVSAEFQHQVQYDCQTDVITFSHNGQYNVNQWTWTVNGNAASTSQTFTQSFFRFQSKPGTVSGIKRRMQ